MFKFVIREKLIVYPENKEKLAALKAIIKVMKITFEQANYESETYPDHVITGVKKSLKQAGKGQLTLHWN